MDQSQSLACARTFASEDDFVAPVRTFVARPSPLGFLLGAGCAALLVLGLACGTLFLSRSLVDPRAPSIDEIGFGRVAPPSLSLDIGHEERGTVS